MGVIAESDFAAFEAAAALDEDFVVIIDENIGDGIVFEQPFERAEAENFVENFAGEALAFLERDGSAFVSGEAFDDVGDFDADGFAAEFGDAADVEFFAEFFVDGFFDGAIVA